MSEYVIWADSSETGAPTMNNVPGSMIAVLDAFLVNGFNLKSITSLVVAGGVATATCAGHGYSGTYGKDLLIAGSTPAGLNGRKALTFVDTNTFRFDATGITDQTATGTITAKRDSLGWIKQFSGTNKAIYKRSDVTATSLMLRVLDTGVAPATTTDARVLMIESATDVDTFTGASPTTMPVDGFGQYWSKGTNNATAKQWTVIGDSKTFFLLTQDGGIILPVVSNTGGAAGHSFGDFKTFKQGDAYNCFMTGGAYTGSGSPNNVGYGLWYNQGFAAGNPGFCVLARGVSQAPGSSTYSLAAPGLSGPSGGGSLPVYPSIIDGGLIIAMGSTLLAENISTQRYPARGFLPGVGWVLSANPMPHKTTLTDIPGLPGKTMLFLSYSYGGGQSAGQLAHDLTGPW